jgi:hypothetical protein
MQIPIASIKPHPLNESIYGEITEEDVADLIQSIEDVGLLEPIVINSRNQCISGHRRIQACRFSGMESIECTVKEFSEDDAVLFIIEWNRQRRKTYRQLLNEAKSLMAYYVFDSENQVIQHKRIQLDHEKKKIQTQLNLIEDPNKWMSWLDEFDKQVEDLVNLTDGREKRIILEKYVDSIEVDSEDKTHYITIKLTYPIVNDKVTYNNLSNKSDGYRIEEGDDSVSLKTVIPRKRREKRSNGNDYIKIHGPGDSMIW